MHDKPVAEVLSVGGMMRPVYVDDDGRQFVLDDDGHPAHGVWLHPDRWPVPFSYTPIRQMKQVHVISLERSVILRYVHASTAT